MGWDGRTGTESNQWLHSEIDPLIQKYATSLGLNLTPEQANEIYSKVVTPFAEDKYINGVNGQKEAGVWVGDAQRQKALDEAKAFLLPTISQYKMNPTSTTNMTVKAGETIKSVLGRDATPDEAAYFAKELAQGKTPYELQQELMSLPEYQKAQAAKDREALGQELLTQQQLAFQKATPTIISQFMKAGRIGSSGLDAALANAQKELEQQRQGYLGQVGYQDLSSIRGNAYQNYNNATNQFKDIFGTTGQTSTNYNLLGNAIKRMNEQSDYAKQQNDYMNYLNSQNKSNERAALYQLGGSVLGSGLGAFFAA